ncbi:hypothetical protein HS088_TW06G01006 [Tripterygium wilfordii]|uniref:Uncharacterized protein n=1 Tax=Tripterygium wilfordii TaxID=458696 RepID=A0A7J7DKG9_TRIWF|nr:uncharacterized protein LOC119999424 [Tripterygium wilfordii]XP_038702904.1 uncharacterized protein LOC119999424 [Tripterygium wilfordii]XP_038702905.1 uncharacterized protein LOC119999424 [Tripterygium wilfordii]KAF5746831.1 hypothetical protein HS088_TW06G01006 [Tripterygium wilfordii]
MAKVNKVRCRFDSRRQKVTPYLSPSCDRKANKDGRSKKKCSKTSETRAWDDVTCSVCLEYPHHAVLLLCSSYNKGCRPYMCATSRRFSNCLDQYKKAYPKVSEFAEQLSGFVDVPELLCPLCRGQVKGWTVVEPARKYFNAKKRSCMQDNCSFVGTFKALRKHVKAKHPLARPRAVDPVREEKWKKLECERERSDVISTIMSSTPGAVVLGDFVLEPGYHGMYGDYDSDDSLDDGFDPLESFERGCNGGSNSRNRYQVDHDSFDEDDFGIRRAMAAGSAAASRRAFQRIFIGGTRRRRRHRGGNRDH